MLKFLKYLGTTFLALAVFVLILPYFVSLNTYKGEITSQVKKTLDRDLIVDGDIKFRILPRPYIKIKGIKLASIPGAKNPTMVSVKGLEVILSITPLFAGKIEVAKVVLDQPEVFLEKLKTGQSNWEFNFQSPKETSQEVPLTSSQGNNNDAEKTSPFQIKILKIKDATLHYSVGTEKTTVKDINLDIDIEDLQGPIDFDLELKAFDTPLEITGRLKKIGPQIPLEARLRAFGEKLNIGGTFDIKAAKFTGDLKLKGNLKYLKRFFPDVDLPPLLKETYKLKAEIEATAEHVNLNNINFDLTPLKASGSIIVNLKKTTGALDLTLMPGSVQLSLRPDAPQNNQFSGAISLKAKDISEFFSALKIKNIPSSLLHRFSFATHLTYQDQNIALRRLAFEAGEAKLDGQITFSNWAQKGQSSFDIKIRDLGVLARFFDVQLPGNIGPTKFVGTTTGDLDDLTLDVSIYGARAKTTLKGRLQKKDKSFKPALTLTTSGQSLRSTLRYFDQKGATNSLGPFVITAAVGGDIPQRLTLDFHKSYLTIGSDRVTLKGTVDLFLAGLKPRINANLSLSALNLDRLLAAFDSDTTKKTQRIHRVARRSHKKPRDLKTRWSHEKIDLNFLRTFDGDINILAPTLRKGSLVFDSLKMSVRVANGILDLTSLTGKLYGGNLTLKGRLSSQKDQTLALTAHLKGAQLKNILPKRKEIKVLKGVFSLDADLTSQGHSEYQYIANLSGSLNFKGTKGVISGFDLQRIVNDLASVKSLGSALTLLNTSFSGGQTTFNSIDCIMSITKGNARIKKFLLDAVGADVTADGSINLLDYWMDISSKITLEAKGFPPFSARIYGPLDNPKNELKTGKLEQYLIQNVLTDVLDNLSKGGEGAEDLIKGILGLGQRQSPSSQQSSKNTPSKTEQPQQGPQKEIEAIGKAVGGLLKDLF